MQIKIFVNIAIGALLLYAVSVTSIFSVVFFAALLLIQSEMELPDRFSGNSRF